MTYTPEQLERIREAGPALLEALEAVDTECRDTNANGDVAIPSYVWDKISAAIAKAKGE